MALNEQPNRLESVWIQRDSTNSFFEQINVSGSDLIIYHDEDGLLTADKTSVWATKYGIGSGIKAGTIMVNGTTTVVTFSSPTTNTNYSVMMSSDNPISNLRWSTKTVNGFTILCDSYTGNVDYAAIPFT